MRKRKNNESTDKISQGLLIKQKDEKNCSKKIENWTTKKNKKGNKIKGRNKNRNKTTKTTKKRKN